MGINMLPVKPYTGIISCLFFKLEIFHCIRALNQLVLKFFIYQIGTDYSLFWKVLVTYSQEIRPACVTFAQPTPTAQYSNWMAEPGEELKPHPDTGTTSGEIMSLINNLTSSSDSSLHK